MSKATKTHSLQVTWEEPERGSQAAGQSPDEVRHAVDGNDDGLGFIMKDFRGEGMIASIGGYDRWFVSSYTAHVSLDEEDRRGVLGETRVFEVSDYTSARAAGAAARRWFEETARARAARLAS